MQMTVNVPETLAEDVLQKLIAQFEEYLKNEAQNLKEGSASSSSKWERIAHEAHEESPLYGLSGYVLECSKEIRDNFVFPCDKEHRMELRINLGYQQILQLVRQLPRFEQQRLTHEIERELCEENPQTEEPIEFDEFQKLLLNGPVMSDEQFGRFQDLRKGLNAWIEK